MVNDQILGEVDGFLSRSWLRLMAADDDHVDEAVGRTRPVAMGNGKQAEI